MNEPMPAFLSEADCAALLQKVASFARGGGDTVMNVESMWLGNVRWARNLINSASDVRRNTIQVTRSIRDADGVVTLNMIDDAALAEAVRRAEHLCLFDTEDLESDLQDDYQEPYTHPAIWFDATYGLDASHRAEVVRSAVHPVVTAGMLSAGYLAVSAHGRSVRNTRTSRHPMYYPYTTAQYSVTARDPQGTGSGWAGVDWNDWSRIDVAQLSATALDKCLRARNPVAIEPGRYTAILEPQAVCDLMVKVINSDTLDRDLAERGLGPFAGPHGTTKLGEQVLDARITISADPMDPDLGFPPFGFGGEVYNPVVWIEQGVLHQLAYHREWGVRRLHLNSGLPCSNAFRMTGGTTTIEEMIQTTKRGLLVTRLSNLANLDPKSLLSTGYTRDGLWLIEDGKVSKAVKNFRFTESPLFAFNQVDQLGVPQRVFHPDAPVVVPPVKVRDFSFTSLADAV